MLPYRRFACTLADADARLGADVDRYSFTVVDLHHLLLAGLTGAPFFLIYAREQKRLLLLSMIPTSRESVARLEVAIPNSHSLDCSPEIWRMQQVGEGAGNASKLAGA